MNLTIQKPRDFPFARSVQLDTQAARVRRELEEVVRYLLKEFNAIIDSLNEAEFADIEAIQSQIALLQAQLNALNTDFQPAHEILTNLTGMNGVGFVVKKAGNQFITRSIVAGSIGVSIENPSGQNANTKIGLSGNLPNLAEFAGIGLVCRNADGSWDSALLLGEEGHITVQQLTSDDPCTLVIDVGEEVVLTTNVYDDPDWMNSLDWSKIINTPTTLAGYGITDGGGGGGDGSRRMVVALMGG